METSPVLVSSAHGLEAGEKLVGKERGAEQCPQGYATRLPPLGGAARAGESPRCGLGFRSAVVAEEVELEREPVFVEDREHLAADLRPVVIHRSVLDLDPRCLEEIPPPLIRDRLHSDAAEARNALHRVLLRVPHELENRPSRRMGVREHASAANLPQKASC